MLYNLPLWSTLDDRYVIRTPPNPGVSATCEEKCSTKPGYRDITKNVISIEGGKYPLNYYFYVFHNVSGGWLVDRETYGTNCQCLHENRPVPPEGECVFGSVSHNDYKKADQYINIYALRGDARARNIILERAKNFAEIPAGCKQYQLDKRGSISGKENA